MEAFRTFLIETQTLSTLLRLLLAALCGGLIGLERGRQNRPAGLKTHMLVCTASALVMLTGRYILLEYGVGDPARLGAQVISGIGFLGAGTILVDRNRQVRGLTTAAGLWASACVGLALGIGFYTGALVLTALILLVFLKFSIVEKRYIYKTEALSLYCVLEGFPALNSLLNTTIECGLQLIGIELSSVPQERLSQTLAANITLSVPLSTTKGNVLHMLSASPGVFTLKEIPTDYGL